MKKLAVMLAAFTAMASLIGAEKTSVEKKTVAVKKTAEVQKYPADVPLSGFAVKDKNRGWWEGRFKKHVMPQAQKKGKKIQLVFLGDSITHFLESKKYKKIWDEFAYCDPLNVGFSGDKTQHTLWIVEESGLFELIEPKLIILLIGVNNYSWKTKYPPEETSRAIARIVSSLRKKEPQAKIVVFGIFPRGRKAENNEFRPINDEVNRRISKLADGKNVFYENINDKFLQKDGTLPESLFPDKAALHPNEAGYKIWFDAIRPYVYKYIGKPPVTKPAAVKDNGVKK